MPKSSPLVSIGMPVYNGANFIKDAIEGILSQTFEDFELIISDNASTDDTEEICRAYAAQDQRIHYYRNQKNLGGAYNYNRVFELSRGEYFKWAAHDDACAPDYLERCIEVLNRMPSVVLCYPRTLIIDTQGKPINQNYSDDLNLNSPKPDERYQRFLDVLFHIPGGRDKISPIFGLIRKSTLSQTPLIGSYFGSDLVLIGELALLGQFYEVPEYLFWRRFHNKRAMEANPTNSKRTAWYDPAKRDKIVFPVWRLFLEFIASINRVHLSWHERLDGYIQMTKWLLLWGWLRMAKDLILATAQALNITDQDFLRKDFLTNKISV
ncbi:glycosyltransferase family 2 protein [Moorena producens JHB]|uniref:Glycosyltransferase family 2 protein n=1 Tax=Moorena producens (strain JHB) TaxID=1454205 RepID=A0A1D9FU57_MOOP1|nr:glycosyltransferase family 2 protein [Moorena producens]AOY78700.1 glycosyltransferase family 2 protein [Moorena producens JHB]